jgi:hypothetical protein
MANLQYLIIHTTDTPYNREVSADDIFMWHLGMLDHKNGTATYLSKVVQTSTLKDSYLKLPSGNQLPVLKTNGRGWSRVGYSDMIQRSGKLVNLVPYNFDKVITQWEMTNGATNYNTISRHVVLVGGWKSDGTKTFDKNNLPKPEELYTPEQLETLRTYILAQKQIAPFIQVIGHNDVATKTCPNFNVKTFIETLDL